MPIITSIGSDYATDKTQNMPNKTQAIAEDSTVSRLQNQVNQIAKGLSTCFCENGAGQVQDIKDHPPADDQPEMSAMDWLQDVLDINYIVQSDRKTYKSARVLVAFGGPNIWVDFNTNTVEGYWWGSYAEASFEDVNEISNALEELFSC